MLTFPAVSDVLGLSDKPDCPVDVTEYKASYEVLADLPGLERHDVEVEVRERTLCIEAKKGAERGGDIVATLHRERLDSKCSRTVQLPDDADIAKISATMDRGLLKVVIPKMQGKTQRRVVVPITSKL